MEVRSGRGHIYIYTYTYTYIHIYIYIHIHTDNVIDTETRTHNTGRESGTRTVKRGRKTTAQHVSSACAACIYLLFPSIKHNNS